MRYQAIFGVTALLVLVFVAMFGMYVMRTYSETTVADSIDGDTDEYAGDTAAYAAAVSLAVSAPKVKYQVSSSTPQFVVLSFDGSKSVSMLNETLDFERQLQAKGKSLRFTYFINAAYFITDGNAMLYQAPGQARGTTRIGFSSTTPDIALRVQAFNKAFADGNEVGSHSAGHFDGSHWTFDEWKQEFTSFTSLMTNVQQNNPSQTIDAPAFLASIHGFRAPYLGTNDAMYRILGAFNFIYDTSGVGPIDTWPHKDVYGVWRIPLGTIFVGPHRSAMVAMDYNLYLHQSNAKDNATKGTVVWNTDFDQVEAAYVDYFNTNYQGNRAPVVIGEHFSKWNDGVYWAALKTFAEYVCGQPSVRCVTFKELVEYLNTNGPPPLAP